MPAEGLSLELFRNELADLLIGRSGGDLRHRQAKARLHAGAFSCRCSLDGSQFTVILSDAVAMSCVGSALSWSEMPTE